ncbi:MAG: hypothetical protein JSS75_08105 [Bacteroidetes bacterium]|nr:hypothetical protein [Bacteroidota bacterium]
MPSKESYLAYFLAISAILFLLQWFVYRQLKKVVVRDFPDRSALIVRIARITFFVMNIPVAFLFFRRQINAQLPVLTNILLVPYTIWQGLMIVWTLILVPIVVWELTSKRLRNLRRRRT